jgi:hypothetical protein
MVTVIVSGVVVIMVVPLMIVVMVVPVIMVVVVTLGRCFRRVSLCTSG